MANKFTSELEIEVYARDMRMIRAARDVSQKYKITRQPAQKEGRVWFDINGGQKPYLVGIRPDWKERPSCTCPDAQQRALKQNGGFCKHIIAVLLNEKEFKCQLLELFL